MGSSKSSVSKQTRHQITAASALLITGLLSVSGAAAQDFYISGTVGLNNPQDSSNSGRLNTAFTTPAVPGFSSMALAAGTPFSWNTDFSNGETYAVAFGYNYDPFRVELALQRASNNVDKHSNFTLNGMDISAANVGILGTGVTGTTVEGYISPDGRMESTSVMLNVYYDFDWEGDIDPYVGIGIGNAEEEVVFSSATGSIVDGQENDFAWQLIAGFQYQVDDSVSFFGQYRYFNASDPDFRTTFFPGTVGVENQYQAVEFGLRFSF